MDWLDEPTKTIGWDYSAEYVQLEPVVDEFPIKSLCIKEQFLINGKPNGEARYHQVPEDVILQGAGAVTKLMQALADSTRRTIELARKNMTEIPESDCSGIDKFVGIVEGPPDWAESHS